jgi:hypothetical protein
MADEKDKDRDDKPTGSDTDKETPPPKPDPKKFFQLVDIQESDRSKKPRELNNA